MFKRTREGYLYEEFIYCYCGCGFTRSKYDFRDREIRFINHHHSKGRKHTEETKRKLSEKHIGKTIPVDVRIKISESLKGEKNHFFGKHHSQESLKKISETSKGRPGQKGEKNHFWKGNDVTYGGLHVWIRMYFPQPDECQLCNKVKYNLDLANISGIYNREFKNWAYLCRKCHLKFDNIHNRMWITRKK